MDDSGLFSAQVIVSFGRQARVRDTDGRVHAARAAARGVGFVCGDWVECHRDSRHGEVYIRRVLPRRTVLQRSNARGGSEAVVANIDWLGIVAAVEPKPDLFLIDRYIAAAQSAGIGALLLVNKLDRDGSAELLRAIQLLGQSAGATVLGVSALTGAGLDELARFAADRLGVLVGQSGVGKSSLLRALAPGTQLSVRSLDRRREGRHATTRAEAIFLPSGGAIIDAPGVRDFAPALSALPADTLGFADIAALAPACRFKDCRHGREPQCAVRAAAAEGRLDPRRYASYRQLRRLRDRLSPAVGRKRGPSGL
ncbi:MAG: ribosome small subunit-dependent GTPase A [Steroidobacteraceae bacterium]|nr:ribosome small subunit-dependent GTPase A [Steroidobacteraceae bacterium]MDW8260305.1 ribosome small subunit-dependent GTPase A [Gammaproteobacteria bacterium]